MDDRKPIEESASGKDEHDDTSYERWKFAGDWVPFRAALVGTLTLGLGILYISKEIQHTRYWWLSVVLGLSFAGGLLSLLYDIPQRRLGKPSMVFLGLGFATLAGLIVIGIVRWWMTSM